MNEETDFAWRKAKKLIAQEMKLAYEAGKPIRYDAASIKAFARYIEERE